MAYDSISLTLHTGRCEGNFNPETAMAAYINETRQYLQIVDGNNTRWTQRYSPGEKVPVSGIYRCTVCGKEITSNGDAPFPPQNRHQNSSGSTIIWQMMIRTDTQGDNFGIR